MEPHPHHKVLCITSVGVNVLYLTPHDDLPRLEEKIIEVSHELTESGLSKAVYVRVDIRRLHAHSVRTLNADGQQIEVPGTHIKLPLYELF